MRSTTLVLTIGLLGALAVPATAGPAKTYTGKATSTDRSFRYGKVTVKTAGKKVTLVKIEGVTTTGCGGFMSVIFSPGSKGVQITKGSATIKGGKLAVTYRPTSEVPTQKTELKATITASTVTGTFKSGELCENAGRFSAKR
jgi:hypothetical protein